MPTLADLNNLPKNAAEDELLRCCGSRRWARAMAEARPFADTRALFEKADRIWDGLTRKDWLEAFGHHPRIGDVSKLREKFAATAKWASDEQKGTSTATEATLRELATGNEVYENKFGHVFLVCATGKSAEEMLILLRDRIKNDPATELRIAAVEQSKITKLRLEKLLNP